MGCRTVAVAPIQPLAWELPYTTSVTLKQFIKKKKKVGVPTVAQWLTNPTRNREVSGLIPGLAQWNKDLALREPWCRLQMQLGSRVAVAVV